MRRKSLPRLLLVILGVIVLVLGCWYCLPASPMDYVVEAEFEELPQDDRGLKEWLRKQPGVYIAVSQRHGNRVLFVWGNCCTSYRNAVTPDLREHFEKFGYKSLIWYRESKNYRDQ